MSSEGGGEVLLWRTDLSFIVNLADLNVMSADDFASTIFELRYISCCVKTMLRNCL